MKTPTHDDATGQRAYAIMRERLAAHHAAIARGEPSAAPAWNDCLEAARAETPAVSSASVVAGGGDPGSASPGRAGKR